MARKIKYHTLEELRAEARRRSREYYKNNKELIKAKAKDKRRRAKEQQQKLENGDGKDGK